MAGKLVALIVPLGLDTFAVAAGLGAAGLPRERRLRLALLFSGAEASMPLVGLALGLPLGRLIGDAAGDVAIAVLLGFGLYTLLAPERDEQQEAVRVLELGPRGALLLALGISLDELAIGFTLGLLRLPVGLVIALIAAQAFAATLLGLRLGHRLGERLREGAERAGGAALILLALVLLVERVLN